MATLISRPSIAAAAVFSLMTATAALAAEPLEEIKVQSERVSYSDLNLDNEDGREALRKRLKAAAKRVCTDVIDAGSGKFTHNRDCRDYAYHAALVRAGLETQTAKVDH